jgi:TolB-like protein/lipopolysaccharide biosynthesis regulator YciM
MAEGVANRDEASTRSHRLESWKEIAAYLGRNVRTVQRWERREGLPVHRLQHNKLGSVFAHTAELDAWRDARDPEHRDTSDSARRRGAIRRRVWVLVAGFAGVIAAAIGLGRVADRGAAVGDPPIRSLAVLPLEDFSPEPRQPYLPDGMTEALIGELSVLHELQVISRTSVMQFKGTRTPVPEIARLLNVDAVIEGSVQRSGNRLRISAQLVRAASGRTLWSGAYDRELGDVLALQSEVARIIAREVGATMTPGEHARLTKRRTVVPEAYESYLKGLFHLNHRPEGVEAAVSEFERATARDPSFAPAYAHLAAAYQALGSTSVGVLPVSEARPKAIAAANRALAIDPHVARAHAVLARAHQQEWRWQEAEAAYRRAIEIDPSDAVAHAGYAGLLVWRGRTEEGLAYQRRARELDALSAQPTVDLGWLLYHARRYDDAIRELKTVLAVEPDHRAALWFLSFALIDSSRVDEAIQVLERLVVLRNRNPADLGLLARAYGRAGRRGDAQRIVDELQQRQRAGYVPPAPFVHAYVGVDDRDRAFAALERAYDEGSNIVQSLRTHPLYDPLRNDQRFAELLRRVRLQ